MDIISHALWSGALFKSINLKLKRKKFNFWYASFWGIFPDIFAFIIPYVIWFFALISGKALLSGILQAEATTAAFQYYSLVETLYNISHSIIIFLMIFLIAWIIFRKPIWVMFGWLLHIIMDIFTHIKGHFPTPILWPISNFKFDGLIYWREPWFMIVDVLLLIMVYWIILKKEKKRKM